MGLSRGREAPRVYLGHLPAAHALLDRAKVDILMD